MKDKKDKKKKHFFSFTCHVPLTAEDFSRAAEFGWVFQQLESLSVDRPP